MIYKIGGETRFRSYCQPLETRPEDLPDAAVLDLALLHQWSAQLGMELDQPEPSLRSLGAFVLLAGQATDLHEGTLDAGTRVQRSALEHSLRLVIDTPPFSEDERTLLVRAAGQAGLVDRAVTAIEQADIEDRTDSYPWPPLQGRWLRWMGRGIDGHSSPDQLIAASGLLRVTLSDLLAKLPDPVETAGG